MQRTGRLFKRILAIACMMLVIMSNFVWLIPSVSFAETAGAELVVRVQYYGESGDKIREKARFSRAELEAMGASTHYYSNITRVGTVMVMKARGPEVMTIISQAGIDASSIKNITFRTTDGYTRNFNVGNHMTATRYYYPNLSSCYEKNEDGNALTPLEGAVEDRTTTPSILALEFGESKMPGDHAEDLSMSTNKSYRFCMGQTNLTEGRMTNPRDDGGDITSMESCHSIYGIDVTLSGAPPEEEGTDDMDDNVGNDDVDKPDDKKDDIDKPNDKKDDIDKPDDRKDDIDKPDDKKDDVKEDSKEKDDKTEKNETEPQKPAPKTEVKKIRVRELALGDKIVQKKDANEEGQDISVLSQLKLYSHETAVGTGVGAGVLCGAGAVSRIIRYKRNFK